MMANGNRLRHREEVIARLRAKLDEIDAQTRKPGEPTLRQQVADQARANLAGGE